MRSFIKKTTVLLFFLCFFMTGCFTTLQTAKVRKGFHLSTSTAVLTDQEREGESQGHDILGLITPSYGFGNSSGIEFGVPFGWYLEEGWASLQNSAHGSYGHDVSDFVILPYFKIGLNQYKKDKFALALQTALIQPVSLSVIYSHDFPFFTPYLSLKTVFSGGPAGDDVILTRYQQSGQSVWIVAVGSEFDIRFNPAIELGVMRNAFREEDQSSVQYDWFIGLKTTL